MWTLENQIRKDRISQMATSQLIHLMIINFDGDKESSIPATQNFDYFHAAEELDRRFPVK